VVSDEPKSHWFISNEEKAYVMANRQQTMGEIGARTPPYLKIITNPVVWVVMFSDFANSIASYMVIIEGPNFIANILHKDIKSNGSLSALPHLAAVVYGLIFGFLADAILRPRGCLEKKGLRRLMHGLGFGVPALTAALLGYTTSNWIVCIAFLSLGFGFRSAQYSGHYSVVYDLAPKYSGTVYGMVNMCGNTAGFITPMLTSALTGADPTDVNGWRSLFWLAGSLLAAALVVFMVFVKFEPASFEYDAEKDLMVEGGGAASPTTPVSPLVGDKKIDVDQSPKNSA